MMATLSIEKGAVNDVQVSVNNTEVTVGRSASLNVDVTPVPTTVISISRGMTGPAGPNAIGGYPISITNAQNYDALMFVSNEWVNINQLEIADGGNF